MAIDNVTFFTNRYSWLSADDIEDLEYNAKEMLISLAYPYNGFMYTLSETKKEQIFASKASWIRRAIQEQIERQGYTSVLNYKENGVSMSFDSAQLSKSLKDEIMPIGMML